MYAATKVLLTALIVVAISEIAKRSTALGAIIASLPLTSLLAFVWIYGESGDSGRVAHLSRSIFWYVLPSLSLFLVLPALLDRGWGFWPSLSAACAVCCAAYAVTTVLAMRLGFTL